MNIRQPDDDAPVPMIRALDAYVRMELEHPYPDYRRAWALNDARILGTFYNCWLNRKS
jgi:hypothetical protein